ncbi:unnamed protein product [Protopolystoma xenopodis]|uniref:Uncharacterized protein n=1 Tax=Protopolystoma xenopodis TaxID=117903 RepID=A0A3S5CCV2_9PLAT|nr:unnamed protein product [Protopolystoma xenopodis]
MGLSMHCLKLQTGGHETRRGKAINVSITLYCSKLLPMRLVCEIKMILAHFQLLVRCLKRNIVCFHKQVVCPPLLCQYRDLTLAYGALLQFLKTVEPKLVARINLDVLKLDNTGRTSISDRDVNGDTINSQTEYGQKVAFSEVSSTLAPTEGILNKPVDMVQRKCFLNGIVYRTSSQRRFGRTPSDSWTSIIPRNGHTQLTVSNKVSFHSQGESASSDGVYPSHTSPYQLIASVPHLDRLDKEPSCSFDITRAIHKTGPSSGISTNVIRISDSVFGIQSNITKAIMSIQKLEKSLAYIHHLSEELMQIEITDISQQGLLEEILIELFKNIRQMKMRLLDLTESAKRINSRRNVERVMLQLRRRNTLKALIEMIDMERQKPVRWRI